MATTSTVKLAPVGIPVIDAMTNGAYWVLDSTRTISWAVADAGANDWKWSAASAALMREAMASVLSRYAEVANIKFQYTNWYDNVFFAPADIVLTATVRPTTFGMSSQTYARSHFPFEPGTDAEMAQRFGSSSTYPNASGDVILNFQVSEMARSTYAPGSNGYFALLHEVGHSLGLKHPHDSGGSPGRPTFRQIDFDAADTQLLTVMSYEPATSLAALLQQYRLPATAGYPETLMPLDVIALQLLYGPNTTTRAGNTTYRLLDDAIETFWDAGGTDLLSASDSVHGWEIWATATVADGNLVVAVPKDSESETGKFYFDIENFTGSRFADSIVAADGDNRILGLGGNDNLEGGGGSDFIDGGTGIDTAYYTANRATHFVRPAATGWTVTDLRAANDQDVLTAVERLAFADWHVALDVAPGGHANSAALALRAILGPVALRDKSLAGLVIDLFDDGISMRGLVAAGISTSTFQELAGSRSNEAFVRLVYKNVVGVTPTAADAAQFIGLLDSGAMSQTDLGVLAATVDINRFSPELMGIASRGFDFLPWTEG